MQRAERDGPDAVAGDVFVTRETIRELRDEVGVPVPMAVGDDLVSRARIQISNRAVSVLRQPRSRLQRRFLRFQTSRGRPAVGWGSPWKTSPYVGFQPC
jgi:hypothetical protein